MTAVPITINAVMPTNNAHSRRLMPKINAEMSVKNKNKYIIASIYVNDIMSPFIPFCIQEYRPARSRGPRKFCQGSEF